MARLIVRLMLGIVVPCALSIWAACIFGIWQPSTEILFICDRNTYYSQICLTDADRGAVVLLTTQAYMFPYNAVWSPDGRWIAFDAQMYQAEADGSARSSAPGLYVMDARGGQPRLLVADGYDPDWSPDGTKIVFSKTNSADYRSPWNIYSTTLDGSTQLIFADTTMKRNPVWSRDGTQIAFQSLSFDTYRTDIYTVRADGTDLHRVTDGDNTYFDPAWSPDGTKLAYFWAGNWDRDIVLRDLASGATQNLTAAGFGSYGYEGSPVWSADGQRIVFDSDLHDYTRQSAWQIYIMKADGSGLYRVTLGRRPAWRPPRVFSWDDLLG